MTILHPVHRFEPFKYILEIIDMADEALYVYYVSIYQVHCLFETVCCVSDRSLEKGQSCEDIWFP